MHIRTTIVVAIASLSTVGTGLGQVTFEFTDSGQALGSSYSDSVALGDLDGDGDLDAMVANIGANTVTGAGVCCAPSGCVVATGHLSVPCESFGGVYLPNGSCSDCSMVTTGACCVTNGCTVNTEAACTDLGGTWTEGGACDDCPDSCAGDTNGDGVIDIFDLLNMLSDWGTCP